MKILFNTMTLGKGGAERVINLLSNNFAKENEIKIITNINSKVEYQFDEKIDISSLSSKVTNDFTRKLERISLVKLYKMKKEILKFKPDIIISFLPEPSFRVLALKKYCKKIRKIPIIVSVRNDPQIEYKNYIYKIIMKKLYPYADQLVLQTNDAKQYFIDNINFEGIVIQNPVSEEFIDKRFEGIREKRIVAVGRLEPQKNYKMLIDAFKIVHSKHKDYVLNIYGEGYLKDKIKKYIIEKNLQENVFLMGKVNNVKEVINKAEVFVMSSNYEGMPNALLEAACLGIPCVSTDCPCGGPREILKNGENGILIDVGDYKSLAKGILKIIENKNIGKEYGIKSNQNALNYSPKVIVKKWKKLIEKM